MNAEKEQQAGRNESARRNTAWLGALLVFTASIAVYIRTAAPTITFEDSGEFVSAAAATGIAHPPGFPLWCILARLFVFLPGAAEATAFKVNLLSAFLGACATAVAFLLVRLLTASSIAAASAALALGFSRTLWSQSVIAEVYSLNVLLFLLVFLFLYQWLTQGKTSSLCLCCLSYGLSLSNHTMMILLGPALAAALLLGRQRQLTRSPKTLFFAGACFLGGLIPYIYLPVAASQEPALNWGDPSTWENFITHITRKSYAALDRGLSIPFLDRVSHLGAFGKHLLGEFTPVLFPLGLFGIYLCRRNRTFALLSVVFFAAMSLLFPLYLNFSFSPQKVYVMRVYYLNAYAVFALWIGMAIGRLDALITVRPRLKPLRAVLGLIWVIPLTLHFRSNDRSSDILAYAHGMNVLEALPENAALVDLSSDQDIFPVLYLTQVLHKRPDLALSDRFGIIFKAGQSLEGRPIFRLPAATSVAEADRLKGILVADEPVEAAAAFEQRYAGMLSRKPTTDFMTAEVLALYHVRYAEELFRQGEVQQALDEYSAAMGVAQGSHFVATDVAESLYRRKLYDQALAAGLKGIELDDDYPALWTICGRIFLEQQIYEQAEKCLRKALDIDTGFVEALTNLGVARAEQGDLSSAVQLWEKALALEPANRAVQENLQKARSMQ